MNGSDTTTQDLRRYQHAWTTTMVNIWRDRLTLLTTPRTGALHRSITAHLTTPSTLEATWQFRFLRYGIYLDHGRRRPDGTSTRRPWFTPSWNISRRVLIQAMTRFIGEAYIGTLTRLQ